MDQTGEHRESKLSVFRTRPEFTALLILVSFYVFISNFFAWDQAWVGLAFNTSGGSDPYYNYRVIEYILTYHHQLLFDPSLNYPIGANNPRPPFFHWFTVLIAVLISPAVGGVNLGAYYFFNELDALFGALLIIPVYLITNEVFGKKAGIIAATLYTLMPSNLSAGILTDGRMHTPELLFAFFAVYFFQRGIGTISKTRVIENLYGIRSYIPSLVEYMRRNRLATIYALLSATSLGGLILSWQGYPYIEVIILLYVVVQLVINIIMKVPTGHLTYLTIIFILFGFLVGAYPYYALGYGYFHLWLLDPLYMGLIVISLALVFNIFGRRPWIITIPSIVVVAIIGLVVIGQLAPGILHEIISGQGYFVKSRLYTTIGEAQAPQLGQYISGFGAAQFILGMAGVGFIIYRYFKDKKESHLFLLVFSIVSIYMSFAAARFNITAAPAYAALGAGVLVYFAETSKFTEIKKRRVSTQVSVTKSIKGNINWMHALTSVLIVLLMIIPAGFAMVSAAVPANTATSVDSQIIKTIPPALRFGNTSQGPQFVGGSGFYIVNTSQPLSKSLQWLSTQDTNIPQNQRPAYVSWWDYGFQEIYQGQHPAVADDFQQGYQVAGQILLAQNQSQIVSLFISRVIQADYNHNGNSFTTGVNKTMSLYFGHQEELLINNIIKNPAQYKTWISDNSSVYGSFIKGISNANAYYALVKGQLASKYPLSTIVNAYSALEADTGNSIKYIQIDSGQLFPLSGQNTGIFYAPAYLTDTPSYASASGQIVPTNYYQIYAQTANGTFPLNQLPPGLQPLNYSIVYTPQFYNTSIYRLTMGYSPNVAGGVNGIPGVTFGQSKYQVMPAWNMSHFVVTYEGIPWNPYSNYQAHPNAWKLIPLQQAYTYRQEGKGVAEIFPPPNQLLSGGTPIVSYYPGANITGKITLPNGQPAPGMRVTVFDQYGIPHQTTVTNKNGYYSLVGLPGNDTVAITTGSFNSLFMLGKTSITDIKVKVSENQANRVVTGYNQTTGLPSYVIEKNYVLKNNSVSGYVRNEFQNTTEQKNVKVFSQPLVQSGSVELHNQTFNVSYSLKIQNGQYSANNLLPLSYEASVIDGGKLYTNVSYVNISNGASQVNDIFVHFNTLFLNVTGAGGSKLPDYTVKAEGSSGMVTENVTNSTGQAILWVTPGNYTLYAYNNNSVSALSHITFNAWGMNTSLNLTPKVSATVNGQVKGAAAGTTVKFMENGIYSQYYEVKTTANGFYSERLPYGTYTEYVQSGGSVALSTFTLTSQIWENMTLQKASYLSIGSTLKNVNLYRGFYQVLSSDGMLQFNFTRQVTATVALPAQSYSIAGVSSYLGNPYSAFRHVYLASNQTVNLTLAINQDTSVFVYNKAVAGGYNAQSAVDTGILTLYQSNIPVMYTTVGKQGYAQLDYVQNNASQFYVTYASPFYSAPQSGVTGSSLYLPVTPNNSPLHISFATAPGNPVVNGVLQLYGTRDYNLTISNNYASGNIVPGIYYGKITSTTLQAAPANPVYIVTTAGNTYVSPVKQYAAVSVNGAASISLFNSAGQHVADNSRVLLGVYTVYATNGSKVYQDLVNITGNRDLAFNYQQGYQLNLTNSLSLSGGYYLVKTGNMVVNLTKGAWILTATDYQVYYKNMYSNSTGSYYLSGSSSLSLTANRNLNVSVSSTEAYTGIYGKATFGGQPSPYTLVMLLNSEGKVADQARTNSTGYFNITVPHGTYTVYAINNQSSQAYFASETVKPFSGYNEYNISMENGYKTYVSVNLKTQLLQTNVTISIGSQKLLVNSTAGPFLLPIGNFTFSASQTESQAIYNGTTIQVTYGTNYTAYIHKNSYVTVTLEKSEVYSFVITQTTQTPNIGGNGTFDAGVSILNSGNSAVNVTLSSGSGQWSMVFNRTSMEIQPGQIMNVSVNVTGQHNPPAGLNRIPVVLSYNGQTTNGYINANVVGVSGFSASQTASLAIPNGTKVWVPVVLKNTGNEAIKVNFSIPQSSLTTLSEYNWKATFYAASQVGNSVTIPYNTSITVFVVMTPTGSGQAQAVSFDTYFNSTAVNHKVTVSSSVPVISSLSPYPKGQGIMSNYTGNPFGSLEIGLIMIAVIVVAGLIASGVRSRNRGKR
ncbi:hypothetical protein IX51_11200 [uncultured archaeon]|nr:hypothetical protein IX51_11200 [uncultured archaeon]